MLKVFIVDDESVIRIGFRNLDWSKYGCSLVGDAANGMDALSRLGALAPDVIISDICMPQMDGLEFSRLVKRMYPECAVILLTGYDEFAYAQQALNIGVDFLLLKPTNFDELEAVLRQLEECKSRRQKDAAPAALPPALSSLMQSNLLREALLGRAQPGEAENPALYGGIALNRGVVVSLLPDPAAYAQQSESTRPVIAKACRDAAEEGRIGMIFTDTQDAFVCMLAPPREGDAWEGPALLFCQDILSRLQNYHGITMLCGVGDPRGGGGAPAAYRASLHALDNCFLRRESLALYRQRENAPVDPRPLARWREQVTAAMFAGDTAEVERQFDHLRGLLAALPLEGNEAGCDAVRVTLYSFALDTLQKLKTARALLIEPPGGDPQPLLRSGVPQTLPGVYGAVRNQLLLATRRIGGVMRTLSATDFISYIQSHFADADLSLEMLAETFKLSPSHVSRMIKRETGVSFVEHLTRRRVDRAKELLAETELLLNDIAAAVGFRDMSYFIHVFKRSVGITPNSYRRLHRAK